MIVYRVMSDAECADLEATNRFRPGPNSSEDGKWFARSESAARLWGEFFEKAGFGRHKAIVRILLPPKEVAEAFSIDGDLDGIGPAMFVANDVLNRLSFQVIASGPRRSEI